MMQVQPLQRQLRKYINMLLRFFHSSLVLLSIVLLATACVPQAKKTSSIITASPSKYSQSKSNKEQARLDLTKLSDDFLYLSSQAALAEGNGALAITFLEALAKRDPQALEPQIQLISLLVHSNENAKALTHLNTIISQDAVLTDEQHLELNLMRMRLLVTQNKYEQALSVVTKLAIRYRDNAVVQLYRARLLAEMQRIEEALVVVKILLVNDDSIDARLLQARLLITLGRLQEADKALQSSPQLSQVSQAVLLRSELAARQKNWLKAESILRNYLQQYPVDSEVNNALAKMMIEQQRLQDAIYIYDKMAQQLGSPVEIMQMLGLLHLQIGQYKQAEIIFTQAVENHPDDKKLLYFLAIAFEHNNKQDAATALYSRFGKDDPSYAEVQLRLSEMDWDAGNYAAIEKRLRALLLLQPAYAEAYTYLASSLLEQKRFDDVLVLIDAASKNIAEFSPVLQMKRAAALEELHRLSEAEIVLRQIYDITPDDVEVLNFLGYVLAERGHKLAEAETLILAALARKPNDPYYLDSLAWVYFQGGTYEKALQTQLKAYQLLKNDPVVNEHLGDIYWRLDAAKDARHYWQRALDANHNKPTLIKQKIINGLLP